MVHSKNQNTKIYYSSVKKRLIKLALMQVYDEKVHCLSIYETLRMLGILRFIELKEHGVKMKSLIYTTLLILKLK